MAMLRHGTHLGVCMPGPDDGRGLVINEAQTTLTNRQQDGAARGGVTWGDVKHVSLMTAIHHPQLKGSQQSDNCSPLAKKKAAPYSLQLARSGTNLQSTTPTGNADPSFAQTTSSLNCGASCPLLEAAKNQEISLSQGFSFCYQQDIKSAKQNLVPRRKSLSEEVLDKVEDTLSKPLIKKRSRSHTQSYIDMEGRVLSDIKNTCQGAPRAPSSDPTHDIKQTGLSQRRERHNRMERDRRHRIRVCCDELNGLVPFCTMETDKATTLQWTTAFLKYIQERQGDTLKKEFETVFCRSAGRRLRIAKSEGPKTDLEEAAGSSSHQNVK
ncbi:transcription factor-like 5 protein [Leptodactylus fuscus]